MELEKRKRVFANAIIKWGQARLRDFPWRDDTSPFKVFIAEILLKRTTSTAAKRIYTEFLSKYPDVASLATAKVDDIEEVLKPIGLYKQRSVGLKEAAEYILTNYKGQLPSTYENLLKVPHVGAYTAGAVASFGFGKAVPIIDSNVRRVVTRVFEDLIGEKPSDKDTLEILKEIIPKEKPKLFNWSLIDIGSQICSYRFQKCAECPLTQICYYNRHLLNRRRGE